MKNLIYKHANENGDTTTIRKSGQSWLSCLGQIDEQLVHYCGQGATMATVLLEDLGEIASTLDGGQPYCHRDMAEPESNFDLTQTDEEAPSGEEKRIRRQQEILLDAGHSPDRVAEWLMTKPFDGGAK